MINKVVYILGAGFSHPLGLPIMSNFLEKSKDIYFEFPQNEEKYPHFKRVFSTISAMNVSKSYFKADLFNIEEILSILEMSTELGSRTSNKFFIKYIIDVINYYTPLFQKDNKLDSADWDSFIFGSNKLHNFYGSFIMSLFNVSFSREINSDHGRDIQIFNFDLLKDPKSTYSIITLNYDLILENICKYISDKFNFNVKISFLKEYSQDISQPILSKLHGSVDSGNIIPPTWNKVLRRNEIKNAWQTAYSLLMHANHIRILGYSLPFTDSYIKYLLKSSIIHSQHLKNIDVICLDDTDRNVIKRYNDFIQFNNYRFKSDNIVKYLELIFKNRLTERNDNYMKIINYNRLESSHEDFMRSI